MVKLRASYKKMEQIEFYDTTTHLVPLIWERSGNVKFDLGRTVEDPQSLFE